MRIKQCIICIFCFLIAVCVISVALDWKELFSLFDENNIDCYVITMRTPDRMKSIEENQSKVSFNIDIFDAINGTEIDINKITDPIIDESFKNDKSKTRKHEIGCYLSHYNLYKKIASENNKNRYTIIFEDDFLIHTEDFENRVIQALKDMEPHDFDILYMYNTSDNIGDKFIKNVCKCDKSKNLWGTMAYIVKNANINKIINETKIMDAPIDVRFWKSNINDKLNIYTFCPFIAKTNELPSTIQIG